MTRRILACAWWGAMAGAAAAAAPAFGTDFTLAFGKNLNVWSWNGIFAHNRQLSSKWSAGTNASFDRKVSDSPGYLRRSTVVGGDVRTAYVLHPRLTLALTGKADLSRVQSGASISEVETNEILPTVLLTPVTGLSVKQGVGRAYDRRRNVSDAGLAYETGVTFRPLQEPLGSRGWALVADYQHKGVSSRQGDVTKAFTLTTSYAREGWLNEDVRYSETRDNQKYVSLLPANPILRRNVTGRSIRSSTMAVVPLLGSVQADAGYTRNSVEDDASNDPNDLKYRTNNTTRGWMASANWTLPFSDPVLRSSISMGRTHRDAEPIRSAVDTTLFLRNDLDRRMSELALSVSAFFRVAAQDSFVVSGTLALNKDRTPAETELNDRDDYRRSLVGAYWHTFGRSTVLELRGERTETHSVWLKTQRSSGNRWDRVLNLWAITNFERGRLGLSQRTFFRTAMEEFDYDYLTPTNPQSRNTRLGRLEWQAKTRVGERDSVGISYSVEARTLGNLLPSGPGQRPKLWQLTRNELIHVVSVSGVVRAGSSWKIAPSVAYDRQQGYVPTQAQWNPFALGRRVDKQEGFHAEAAISCAPPNGLFSRRDEITASVSRSYRKRAGLTDTMNYISVIYRLHP